MGIQAQMSASDPRLYSADRDVAHNFGFVAKLVAKRLDGKIWPELDLVLDQVPGRDDVEIGHALNAFIHFVAEQPLPEDTMETSLTRCGFLDCPPYAQVAVMAMFGQVLSGIYWAGIRNAHAGREAPVMAWRDLASHGERCAEIMSRSRWLRRWGRFSGRFRAAYSSLRGR